MLRHLPRALPILLLSVLLVSGCRLNGPVRIGMPEDPGAASMDGVHGLLTVGGIFSGSGIQWNEEYYVTARHIYMLTPSSHACHCDLKFIKRDARGPIPKWRDARHREPIMAVGYNTKVPLSSKGRALSFPVIVDNPYAPDGEDLRRLSIMSPRPDLIAYQAHTAPLMSSMSGGAVVSVETGEVLGMNISFAKRRGRMKYNERNGLDENTPVSIYVPYQMIQASWDNYQREKQGELRWLLPGQSLLRRASLGSDTPDAPVAGTDP